MRLRPSCIILSVSLILPIACSATTYLVRPEGFGKFPTIQDVVDASVSGDVIELANGIFRGEGNRDLLMPHKSVTLRSQSGDPGICSIDCE